MRRRLPRREDLRQLVGVRPLETNPTERRLRRALTIEDLRTVAARRTPRSVFDFAEGAASGEQSLRRARESYADLEFRPGVLRNVSTVDTATSVLGGRFDLPFGVAPVGLTRLLHTEGELAGAAAAAQAGIPFTLSTMATTSIERIVDEVPGVSAWFQLYMWKDRRRSMDLVQRAAAAGCEVLVLTVDVPVPGARLRDQRNGFTIPPQLTPRTILDLGSRPAWWFNLLTTEPLEFATLSSWPGTIAELLDEMFDPTVDFADLEWIRDQWPGKIVVKGIQTVADAERVVSLGVDGIVLSSHGGRQLDRAPVPFHLVPQVRDRISDSACVLVDTGVLSGADIAAALAMGADFVLVGRAYLYGLMAGGRRGAVAAVQILEAELRRTMALLGVSRVADLEPAHVRQLSRRAPVPAAGA